MFRPKKIYFLILVLVIIAGVFLLGTYMDKPSVGRITEDGAGVSTESAFNFTPVKVTDKFIAFSYPKSLHKVPNNPQYAPQVDEFNYSYKDSQTWDLSISTDQVSYAMTSNSGYMLRKNSPQEFVESQQSVDGAIAYIFEDKTATGFSKVAFMQHGGYQASVSLTGDDSGVETNLQKTFNQVLSSWHWQVN
jgi:hypothetical protein